METNGGVSGTSERSKGGGVRLPIPEPLALEGLIGSGELIEGDTAWFRSAVTKQTA